ncbi:probable RNA helicase SDE3 [Hevea brasiliensis]|uniref:probable RNA helicase SDE3 n=1 Tax=Hevea brasiliensis TaxID=3981 RepID=UPI0025D514EB|nr:probable RNA helicase SDE3 [Hevea brasiliensis]XP_021679083.2 probable RNA helicase SDE3 [Hevea brasiliensis]XP_021679084.2 probable RNA helicase SDE3 [Hevea brasiliensis]XP_021679087.2 probable RNA helicase SDE3 [Hevea brasiliensis]XP_058007674.1 probable RNA helicase SDE3 [Hevea brasiliensis]
MSLFLEILRAIFGSGSRNSANSGSTNFNSVERIYDVSGSSNRNSSSPETSSCWLPQSSSKEATSSSSPTPSRPKPPASSSYQRQSLTWDITSYKPSLLSPAPPISSKSSPRAPKLPLSSNQAEPLMPEIPSSKPSPVSLTAPTSSLKPSTQAPLTSFKPSPSPSEPLPSFKPTLAPASSNVTSQQTKANYVLVQKDASPIYMIPMDIQDLIKKDKVPGVLKRPLSMSTYKDYFAALLYAEDFYVEKWSQFKLENITLKLQQASIFKLSSFSESHEKDNKTLVTFEIDSCHERRPFLLSRDFVFARPSGNKTEPFQGVIYRVVRSTTVLVEFSEDFYAQHHSSRRYDVSFSFNRVCLKRAHQAVEAASDPLFKSYIFPDCDLRRRHPASSTAYFNYKLDADQTSAVRQILAFQGPPPYLIEGPLCVTKAKRNECRQLSKTGLVIQEAVLEIYRSSQQHRVLICAPINNTCDLLTSSLKKHIPESEMFRANAAFREIDGVPTDILPSCIYAGECFSCPRLQELRKYRVILSTYVSSFRLCNEGIAAGHFSHIFLVDASSATEPEAMVALANLANEKTAVIVTGAPGNHPGWVRSDIARKSGLMDSYFERLRKTNPYNRLDSMFITKLDSVERKSDDTDSFQSFSFY